MRKLIILALMAATAMPAAASAQSAGEVRRSGREVREQQRDLQQARRYGDRDDVRRERRDVREARQEYREDRRDYRQDRRQDRRDDWRSYRNHNRSVYSRGNWNAPFRYRTFGIGATLGRNYYAPRYYISDPYRYRLPAAGRHLRWIRHYDDVLLVNVRTGRVVNVIRNFYW